MVNTGELKTHKTTENPKGKSILDHILARGDMLFDKMRNENTI